MILPDYGGFRQRGCVGYIDCLPSFTSLPSTTSITNRKLHRTRIYSGVLISDCISFHRLTKSHRKSEAKVKTHFTCVMNNFDPLT